MNARQSPKDIASGTAHLRIGMNWEDEDHILVSGDEVAHDGEVRREYRAEALAAVCREGEAPEALGCLEHLAQDGRNGVAREDRLQGVHNRVAGDEDVVRADALSKECLAVARCGGEMERRQARNQPAVHLLRIRTERVAGAEARLN